jgi:hypothetical protein
VSNAVSDSIQKLDTMEENELSSILLVLHLTFEYESRYNLHIIRDIIDIHDNWKKIFLLVGHNNLKICKYAIDLVTDAIPKKKFSIGMIYFIFQSLLVKLFELCRDSYENAIIQDMLQLGLISLVVLLNKEYQTVDLMVDFVMDSFYTVFKTKQSITRYFI